MSNATSDSEAVRQMAYQMLYLPAEGLAAPSTRADFARTMEAIAAERDALAKALAPLKAIADAYDANELDDEARKHWGINYGDGRKTNTTPPEQIGLYQGRGGKRLLTLADCFAAREALVKDKSKTA